MKTRALVLAALLGACAGAGPFRARPEIPVLERRAADHPQDVEILTTLGIAYYDAGRYAEAQAVLERAASYQPASQEVQAYLALIARARLRQEAKLAVARERELSEEPPAPRTIAVLPFDVVGGGSRTEALQTALTDMIITDLSVSPAVASVERVRIGAMMDELLLAQAGLAEPETGARVGRLLKAEHVVQGILTQSEDRRIRVDATVLNTARGAATGSFDETRPLDAIFDLEKQLVFNIFDVLGVTLTDAERERINENRVGSLIAFLAYGRGLEALDRANYQEASGYFRQASRIDPAFQPVQLQQEKAELLQAIVSQPVATADLMNAIRNETVPSLVTATTQSEGTEKQQNQAGNIQQSQGKTGGVTQAARTTITITIRRP